MFKICGIDASTKSSGISLLSDSGELLDYRLVVQKETDKTERINKMIISLTEVLTEWKPSFIFMEDSWNKINVEISKMLTMVIGAINYWALINDAQFFKIIPSEWRALVGIKTGRGITRNELKEKAIEYANTQFGINVNDDVAESIGLAAAGLEMISDSLFE